jgi:hypothetical protein
MALKPHERHVLDFLLKHLLYGTFGGFLFGGLILATDLGGIRTLIWSSNDTVLFLVLLFFGLFITFGSVGMGIGIMSLGEDKN